MNSTATGHCWYCGADLFAFDYGRGDTCRECGRDTKVCKGCLFFDSTANNQCREPQADRVVEKERSNFCDYFKPVKNAPGSGQAEKADDIRKAAEALFKKK